MKKFDIKTAVTVYNSPQELPEQYQILLQAAKEGLKKSYSPYSNFKVSAAILLENGEILTGANQENAAYTMCLCAERVALATANTNFPEVPVKAIAVTIKNPEKVVEQPAAPCGACRQVLSETEDRFDNKIKIFMQGETGDIYRMESAKDLLPLFFDSSFL